MSHKELNGRAEGEKARMSWGNQHFIDEEIHFLPLKFDLKQK